MARHSNWWLINWSLAICMRNENWHISDKIKIYHKVKTLHGMSTPLGYVQQWPLSAHFQVDAVKATRVMLISW